MTSDNKLTYNQVLMFMPGLKGQKIEISELKGGITNKLYRVRDEKGGDCVFRIYGQKTEMFLDREMEMRAMQLLEPFSISPKVIEYLPEKGVTIIEFIEGYTLKNEDFLKQGLWEMIICPIKILHKSGISFPKIFDPLVEVKKLYKILRSIKPNYPEFDILGTIDVLDKIDETTTISHNDYVFCHNDLLADNFMLKKAGRNFTEQMYLIDWEYAGMNTCYYEFADMFQEILVPREIERQLLETYWNNVDMEYHIYMTDLFKPFPDIYWFLWSLIQLNISTIDFDYYKYGKTKYENVQKNIRYLKENYGLKL